MQSDHDPDQFIDNLWHPEALGVNMAAIGPEAYLNLADGAGMSSFVPMGKKRTRLPREPGPVKSLEALVSYVHAEFEHVLLRVSSLETTVQRIAASQGISYAGNTNRQISRGQLDRHCMATLEQTTEPDAAAITQIAQDLERVHQQIDLKLIISQVRKWFRKRREEMAARVISSFKRHFADRLSEGGGIRDLRARLDADELDLSKVVRDARLETRNVEAVGVFVRQKIDSYLRRLKKAEGSNI